jgi:hypothetical protein
MASSALNFDSPKFEYFPPTPSHSDDEVDSAKQITKPPPSMSAVVPNATPTVKPSSGKVTLHLGHLPSKKDIKGPWPRTPTRVSFYLVVHCPRLTSFPSRSIQTTLHGQPTVDTMNIPSLMLPWVSASLPFSGKPLTTLHALSMTSHLRRRLSIWSNVSNAWTSSCKTYPGTRNSGPSLTMVRRTSPCGTRRLPNTSRVGPSSVLSYALSNR